MKSMTGFGKSERSVDGRKIRVEMKSVNNRFLDLNIRQPRFMMPFEEDVRQYIKAHIIRGRVDVFINYSSEREDSKTVDTDMSLISAYIKAAEMICRATGVENDLTVSQILRLPDAVVVEEMGGDEEALKLLLIDSMEAAVQELVIAREREGKQLWKDITARLNRLLELADDIRGKEHTVVEDYRQKLSVRLEELLGNGNMVDEQRLAQEVAIYADKANITEELVRIESHVRQFHKLADAPGAQGRNMDFIVQELNREFNTIGSKSQDTDILNAVMTAKGEIEKIREQIQNIE